MGGLDPPYEPSPRLYSPPREGCLVLIRVVAVFTIPLGTTPKGADPKGQPLGGDSRVILPRMAPLISGLLGFAGEYSLVAIVTDFLPIYMDFLGRFILSQ